MRRIKVENQDSINEFRAVRISDYLPMPPPMISRIFNSLEGKGLIKRSINQENRRSVVVTITDEGESALNNAQANVNDFLDSSIAAMGESDSLQLLTLLEKFLQSIDQKIEKDGIEI